MLTEGDKFSNNTSLIYLFPKVEGYAALKNNIIGLFFYDELE